MKKVITIFGMIALATGVFFSSNIKPDQNLDLASIIAINSVNAEEPGGPSSGDGVCCALVTMETCYTLIYSNGYHKPIPGYFIGLGSGC